jgi:hypothetical protein
MLSFSREEQEVRLHEVVLGQYDVERCIQHDASMLADVVDEGEMALGGHDLMNRKR